ncbi:unnamed protein product [Coregonus sp. 'balchen']|nr:unnamed protein product [Coregonus sp. 'balchen']
MIRREAPWLPSQLADLPEHKVSVRFPTAVVICGQSPLIGFACLTAADFRQREAVILPGLAFREQLKHIQGPWSI